MIAFIVILSFVSFTFTSQFQAKTVYGNISWYDAIGRVGYDGKVLGKYDCALKLGFDNPPKGTKITVTETKSYRSATVYKWDMGNLPDAVIDVQLPVFTDVLGYDYHIGLLPGFYIY